MFRSVRLRLTAYVIGVLTLVLLAAGASVYVLLSREFDATVESALHTWLPALSNATYQVKAPPDAAAGAPAPPTTNASGPTLIAATGPLSAPDPSPPANIMVIRSGGEPPPEDGTFLAQVWNGRTTTMHGSLPAGLPDPAALAAASVGHDDERTVRIDGVRYRLLTRALPDPLSGSSILLQAGISLATRDAEERSLLLALAGGGLLSIALIAAGGIFLTNRALQPLQLAFERQRRFIADASHELRTPLTLVGLEAEDLAARLGDARQARPLLSQIGHASRLVEDLMTLARLDQHALPIEPEPVHAATLLETTAAAARRLAAAGVSVTVSAPDGCWLTADRDRLNQVLLILIDNACRVTPIGGSIRLAARCTGNWVTMSVSDSGPGISAEHLPRVFDRFYRSDAARTRTRGGAGLGLAIARELIVAQGGRISLESPPGAGAVATIVLPAAAVPASLAMDAPPPGLQA